MADHSPEVASPLLAVILLAIDQADTLPILGQWWSFHQQALRRLHPAELAAAVAHKDTKKAAMQSNGGVQHSTSQTLTKQSNLLI